MSGAVIAALSTLVIAASTIAHIHGRVVSIDERHGTFFIHHDPFAAMPMAMTMEVQPKHRATDIRPARGSAAGDAQRSAYGRAARRRLSGKARKLA